MSTTDKTSTARNDQPDPPQLTAEQKQAIQHAASHLVATSVMGYGTDLPDPTLADAAAKTVMGCFLTIKRRGRLRGCCGFLGRRTSLGEGLTEASVASATRDVRLPSISPTEFEYLDLTVSLLHSLRPVAAQGEDRIKEVIVGRHGLQIARGASRGLLLPSVATEHNLDARQFLQQVCLKAGLPPTAWIEDETHLMTFESETFGGPLDQAVLEKVSAESPAMFREGQLAQLATACRDNILSLLRGATPTYYMPNCPDGTVQGVTVALRAPGWDEAIRFTQLSIRPGVPLQTTLLDLAKLAMNSISAGNYDMGRLHELKVDLTVLHDPSMHGTVAAPDLKGIDPSNRAVLVMEGDRSAWTFDPDLSAQQLLDGAVREALVKLPESASILSLRAFSTEVPVTVAAVPRAQRGPSERPPAVAGAFYPVDPEELARTVDELLPKSPVEKWAWPAAMVPHAGLKYSGRLAAEVFHRIDFPETIIIVGPKHTRIGVDWAVAPHEVWSLPGSKVPSDPELVRQLSEAIPDLQPDAAAHAKEHCIEVQLPLLARLAPQSRVVGITVGASNLDRCLQFSEGLAGVLRDRDDRTLLVISSDMNHFASDAETRRVDEIALAAIEQLDAGQLYRTVKDNSISMCGLLPAVVVLETLRQLGQLRKFERVGYATSADISGDPSRVVGYAGMLFG